MQKYVTGPHIQGGGKKKKVRNGRQAVEGVEVHVHELVVVLLYGFFDVPFSPFGKFCGASEAIEPTQPTQPLSDPTRPDPVIKGRKKGPHHTSPHLPHRHCMLVSFCSERKDSTSHILSLLIILSHFPQTAASSLLPLFFPPPVPQSLSPQSLSSSLRREP